MFGLMTVKRHREVVAEKIDKLSYWQDINRELHAENQRLCREIAAFKAAREKGNANLRPGNRRKEVGHG